MGCNTSKESVPQEETKDNQEEAAVKEDKQEIRLTDNKAEITDNHIQESDSKPASAKTITLHSNGSATATSHEYNKDESKQSTTVASKDEEDETNKDDPEEEAATKIQAAFRGHKTRKSMKQPTGKVDPSTASSHEPSREELEAEFRMDDQELCQAATKIQASFRGHMTRKQQEGDKKDDENGSSTSQSKAQEEEELDIDLSDPDLNKAAVRIQATFRGHMTRKDPKAEN